MSELDFFQFDGTPEGWGNGELDDSLECKWIKLLRERQRNDLERSLSEDPDFPFYFDSQSVDDVLWFFHTQLRHTKGKQFAGKPILLEPWQVWDVVAPAFGWKNTDGTRRFNRILWVVARKNTKSTIGAGIGNYLAFGDSEPGAEVYAAATKERQAKIVWGEAKRQVKRSPLLRREVKTLSRELLNQTLDSVFTVLGRDSDTEDGLNPHGAIIDEYHAHKDSSMLGVLETGTEARDEWQIWIISTAGFNPASPLRDEQQYAEKILQGSIKNETYHPVIYTVDDPEQWHDPKEWRKANPQLGISISYKGIEAKCKQALDQPSKRNQFKVKNLNIWSSGTEVWMDMTKWKKCGGPVDWSQFEGEDCALGVDFGRNRDLTALCAAFKTETGPEPDDYKVSLLMRYWLPEQQDLFERSREDEADFIGWAEAGLLTLTPGPTTRPDAVRKEVHSLSELFNVRQIAYDPWQMKDVVQDLDNDGFEMVKFGQTMNNFRFPMEITESLVLSQRLEHDDHEILRWNMANAIAVYDGNGNSKIRKDLSKFRVDGAVAALMAIGKLLTMEEEEEFVYNSRGLYVG